MKICIADGHSEGARGASGYIDEYDCAHAYTVELRKYLEAAGYEVVAVLDGPASSGAELAEKVNVANSCGADLFVDIHFNAGGGTGTECYYHAGNDEGRALAERMSANVASALGLRDRGAKTANFYVLRNTRMTAVLLETCFVDSAQDAEAWHATSWDALCNAVVSAIRGEATEVRPDAEPADKPAAQPEPAKPSATQGFGGPYRCQVDGLRIRTEPRLGDKFIVRRKDGSESSYSKGETVNLDDRYYIADGYVWGTYIGNSGNRRYIAVGKATGKPEPDDYLVKI